MLVLAALHIIVSQQYRMEVARVNAFRGAAGLGCSVAVDMQRKQAPFAHHRGQVAEVDYGMFINSWSNVWWNIRCGRF